MDGGPGNSRALDCGAGIGRITKFLLQRHFQTVDLVEQNDKFISQAPKYLGDSKHIGELYCCGKYLIFAARMTAIGPLSFRSTKLYPSKGTLWCHLVSMGAWTPDWRWSHRFLQKMRASNQQSQRYWTVTWLLLYSEGLKPNGILVVKENVTSSGQVEKDEEDSSVTRPDNLLRQLFLRAGLVLLRDLKQLKFPKDLYQVNMYALRPAPTEKGDQ